MVQHVAGALEVSEPVAAFLLSTQHLAGSGGVGVPVVGQDVVLSQLAGSHLELFTALRSRGGRVARRGALGGRRGLRRGRRPGAARDVRAGGT